MALSWCTAAAGTAGRDRAGVGKGRWLGGAPLGLGWALLVGSF